MDKKRPSSLDKKLFLKIHQKKATSFLMASFLNLRNPCTIDSKLHDLGKDDHTDYTSFVNENNEV